MAVSIRELKSLLEQTVGQDLLKEDFSFNKSKFEFNKKVGKNKIKSVFHFYNHAPQRVEFNFTFNFFIYEIEKEKERFYKSIGRDYSDEITILFFEGAFHPLTKKQTGKFQQAFTHVIRDFEKDKNVIDDCRNVLKNEFFTKVLSTYSNLQKFQEVITNDDDFVLKYQGFLASSLIAAKLKGKAELDKLIDFFWIRRYVVQG